MILLSFTGIDSIVVETLTVEYVDIVDTRIADYVGLGENDTIVHLEFHTGSPNDTLDFRMFDYSSVIYKKHRKPVKSIAICTESCDELVRELKWGERNKYEYDIVTYKDIDGNIELNSIRNKNINGEKLSSREIFALKMILYTSYDKEPHEIMLDACNLTNEAILSQDQLNEIKKFQELTCRKIIDEKYHRRIIDVIEMKNTLYYEDLKKGEERGKEIGKEIGIGIGEENTKSMIIKNLPGKMSISEIADVVVLSEDEVNEIIKNII